MFFIKLKTNKMTLEEAFGWIGASLTVTFLISPIIPFINVIKGQLDFEDIPTDLIGISYINCLAWNIYGNLLNSQQIKFCTTIGFFICLFFIIIYIIYEIKRHIIDAILNILILYTGSRAVNRILTVLLPDYYIVGKICICTTMAFFIYPLNLIYKVSKEKNHKFIPLIPAIFYILSGICWFLYGLVKKDFHVIIPSFVGIIIGIGQIIIKYYYKKNYSMIKRNIKTSTFNFESTGNNYIKKAEDITVEVDEEEGDKIKVKPVKIVNKSDHKRSLEHY